MRTLSPRTQFFVDYADDTRLGSLVSNAFERKLRERCGQVLAVARGWSRIELARRMPAIWSDLERELADYYEAPGRLREDALYPAPERVRPRALVIRHADRPSAIAIELRPEHAAELARWFGEWQHDASPPRCPRAHALWLALDEAEAFAERVPEEDDPQPLGDLTFVGHASVAIGGRARTVFDPFLMPPASGYPRGYQPLTAGQLAPSAVFVTHSHPDHYDLGSLLRFGHDMPIWVPEVARESILAIDMRARLEQLGFTRVRTMRWGEDVVVGDQRVTAVPFYGEQPTAEDVLHPEVRNEGNLYLVEKGQRRILMTADGGDDRAGSLKRVAAELRRDRGAVDVCVGGYRDWSLYPFQYLFTSVARYLLFVPAHLRDVRHRIMYAPHDLVDVAERCGARWVVPYADGGAPWYWERGLGPRLDVAADDEQCFDLPPEAVREAAARRSWSPDGRIPSQVNALVLRPGETIALPPAEDAGGTVQRSAGPHQVWPYSAPQAVA